MAKLKISRAQITFPMTVQIPTPHGDDEVTFEAKHLKASVWAKMREDHTANVTSEVEALYPVYDKPKKGKTEEPVKEVAQSQIIALRAKISTQLMLSILNSWDLDDPFNEEQLIGMCELYPASAEAVFKKYNETWKASAWELKAIASALYEKPLTLAEARSQGFELEDFPEEEVAIWPEHLQALQIFQRIGTRWVLGTASVIGVRWEAMYPLMDRMNLSPTEWDSLLLDLEVMEHAALAVINEK